MLSGLTICVRDRPCFTVFRMKIEQNSCVIVKFSALLGVYDDLCTLGTDMQTIHFILDKILKL